MTTGRISLAELVGSDGVFIDGDWVESKDQDPDGDVRLLQLADVGDGVFVDKSARFLTSAKAKALKCTFLEPGDILVARMPDPLGRACVFPGADQPCVTVVDVCVVRPGRQVEMRWLLHAINSPAFRAQIVQHIRGTTRQRISRSNLGTIELDVPPLPEQRRIADILDKADAIRRKRKEAIALTEELLRSAFLEMFGDPLSHVEEGTLPAGWRRARVDEIKADADYTCVGGPFGSNLTSKDYVDEGVPVIRGTNLGAKTNTFIDDDFVFVSTEKAATLTQNMAYPGDLVFTQRGTLGQVALIPLSARYPRYVVSQSQMKLTPSAVVTPLYLHSFFCTERMQRYVASHALTTGVPHINLGILRAMPVLVPPKDIQAKFERIAEARSLMLSKQSSAHDAAQDLFDSLVHRAFRGELIPNNRWSKSQIGLFEAAR